jgi:hypothetical protein
VVAGLREGEHGERRRRLAAGEGHAGDTALERRDALLEDVLRGFMMRV